MSFAGRPVFIEPWNVTDREVGVALRLQAPSTAPHDLWQRLQERGRRLFADTGVPVPVGREDVGTVDEVAAAIAAVRAARPTAGCGDQA